MPASQRKSKNHERSRDLDRDWILILTWHDLPLNLGHRFSFLPLLVKLLFYLKHKFPRFVDFKTEFILEEMKILLALNFLGVN